MKKSILLLCTLLTATCLQAQYFEAGAYTGGANYMGDLSGQKVLLQGLHPVFGVFGRYNASKYISMKASLNRGMISGSDEFSRSAKIRERNLSFRSNLLELAFTGEINLSAYNIRDMKTGVPYLFGGVAVTHFRPEAQMRGSWYDLQPLRTEGKAYSRYTVAVPFGLGLKFNLSYKLNFGLEVGARKIFTDYLDDVSSTYPDVIKLRRTDPMTAALTYRSPEITGEFGQNPVGLERGDASNDDWYFFGGLTVSVNLTDKYGLDFDKRYEVFKDHLKKPAPEKEEKVSKRKKSAQHQQREKRRLLRKKHYLEQQVKKRSE
jgi:hypothetical protein